MVGIIEGFRIRSEHKRKTRSTQVDEGAGSRYQAIDIGLVEIEVAGGGCSKVACLEYLARNPKESYKSGPIEKVEQERDGSYNVICQNNGILVNIKTSDKTLEQKLRKFMPRDKRLPEGMNLKQIKTKSSGDYGQSVPVLANA